ncbi:hypothetical protein M9H77_14120 [Catharanthus roseus]|uniref:Uncharacterized protein n=1 Tax=Catharanthus roseus TaxID=4058 RepID=A0ACC0BM52_CATRO|nr:hypothetical protein M9H77_14120 [Catharanthus roseus]
MQCWKGGHGEESEGSRGGKKGKGKQVARSETLSDKFILVKVVADYGDWTKKKRKITSGHRVDLLDLGEGNEPESTDEDEKIVEEIQRELRFKKRQEREYEGQSSVDMAQLMARITTMQSQLNGQLDDIDGKLHDRLDDIDD